MNPLVHEEQQTLFVSCLKHTSCCASIVLLAASANVAQATQNGVQAATFEVVSTICPQMGQLNSEGLLDETQQQLFFRCRELVQTNLELQGAQDLPNSLRLSEDEFNEAVQRIAPEETEVMGAGATDTSQDQLTNLGSRMQVLRTGLSNNSLAGISWSGDSLSGLSTGDSNMSRWGMFINGIYGTGEKDPTREEDGFDYDAYGITLGLDYRYSDTTVAGVALGFSNSDVDLDNNFGEFDTDGYSLSLYGTYYLENWYIEGSLTYGDYDYEGERRITYSSNNPGVAGTNQVVESDTDGEQLGYSLGAGYNGNNQQWHYHLFGRVSGIDADVDAYTETGSELAMRVEDQDVDSLQAILGGQLSYASSQDFGVFMPFISVEARHEFDDESRRIRARYRFDPTNTNFSFLTEDADEDFYLLSVGTSFIMKNGTQVFFNYDSVLDLDDVDSDTLTLGVRFEL